MASDISAVDSSIEVIANEVDPIWEVLFKLRLLLDEID